VANLLKVHLVFKDIDKKMLDEINKYALITGRDVKLDGACEWAQKSGGEDPDLFLINCSPYYIINQWPQKSTYKNLVQKVVKIKNLCPKSRLVLLFPTCKGIDSQLITGLIKAKMYDFWFIDRFDEEDLKKFLFIKRNLQDVEEYLQTLDTEQGSSGHMGKLVKRGMSLGYKPYYIKSNVIAFWSDDESLFNHGLALLTAFSLAEYGFKVALIETVSHLPRLAGTLSIGHPYFNTRHALSMFIQGNNDFIRNCLFNTEKFLTDENSPDKYRHLKDYPPDLYFLPDGKSEDNLTWSELESGWKAFITELTRITIFENNFNFLIFSCQGKSMFNDIVMNELSYLKFITVNMLPGSIVYALNERKKARGNIHIIGTKKVGYITDQLNDLNEAPFLFPPVSFEDNFIDYVYLKKYGRIGHDTQQFLRQILDKIGVKSNETEEKTSLRIGLSRIKGMFSKSSLEKGG